VTFKAQQPHDTHRMDLIKCLPPQLGWLYVLQLLLLLLPQ
jgi:hypothetical protein